ncbi:MAG TPA: hypothetical protein VMQ86_15855 [Bryobacteraceae bacterium]|jgi:hypothetical protein|nr:hypothetical protein [Bryobacteraceae bacterium]
MDLHRDFADLCSLLNANCVDFMIVGGYAVAFHGAPRLTAARDVLHQRRILQLGRQPVQIHVMTSISGVNWHSAWDSRRPGFCADVPVFFIGRDALLANKQAAGRAKDLADVEALRPPHQSSKDIS